MAVKIWQNHLRWRKVPERGGLGVGPVPATAPAGLVEVKLAVAASSSQSGAFIRVR